MGGDAIRHRQGRAHPGQHQPGLSPLRARLRPQQGRLQGAGHRRSFQDLGLCRHVARARARDRPQRAGAPPSEAPADAPGADPHRQRREARFLPLRGCARCRRRAPPCGAGGVGAEAAIRRPHQHPVHQRHHRRAQGRHPHPSQHPQQRLLHRRGAEAHRARPHLHPGAALSLLRHGAGQSRLHHPWRGDGLSLGGLRAAGRARGGRGRALHRPLRRPHHVHRRARPSRVQALRPDLAAHRHHGGLALPDRGDEALRQRDAHVGGDDRLWHDRDQPGEHADLGR